MPTPEEIDEAFVRAVRDLAIAADTAEILLRERYPARAQSLHWKVAAVQGFLDVRPLPPPPKD